tara:strand:+ start:830 stop:1333 length:504 start_codon:yes stop_codon:yes gene_type:complete
MILNLNKYWIWIVTLISFIAICSALIAEFLFELEPCSMCLKQRHPYYFIILLFIINAFIKFHNKIWIYIGIQIASIYGAFYAIWHVGIEKNIINGPAECSGGLESFNNISNLKEQIVSKPVVNCEDVIWSFFGVSAATINTFILILILIINTIYLYKKYGSKKTNII